MEVISNFPLERTGFKMVWRGVYSGTGLPFPLCTNLLDDSIRLKWTCTGWRSLFQGDTFDKMPGYRTTWVTMILFINVIFVLKQDSYLGVLWIVRLFTFRSKIDGKQTMFDLQHKRKDPIHIACLRSVRNCSWILLFDGKLLLRSLGRTEVFYRETPRFPESESHYRTDEKKTWYLLYCHFCSWSGTTFWRILQRTLTPVRVLVFPYYKCRFWRSVAGRHGGVRTLNETPSWVNGVNVTSSVVGR